LGFSFTPDSPELELCDRWILSRYQQTIAQTCDQIETYGLGEAAKGLYEFIWGDFCDWYIELAKSRLYSEAEAHQKTTVQQILAHLLEGIQKLLHPFMPHITEEVWHTLTQSDDQTYLALQSYPDRDEAWINPELEQDFELVIGTIRVLRNLRAEAGVKPGVKVTALVQSESDRERQILTTGTPYIQALAKAETLTLVQSADAAPRKSLAGVVGTVQVLLPLEGVVDLEALVKKLEKDLGKVDKELKSLQGRLNNPGFVNKAPQEVIDGAQAALSEAETQAQILRDRLAILA